MHRRNFLKTSGMALPTLATTFPFSGVAAVNDRTGKQAPVYFYYDGVKYKTAEYLSKLQQINDAAAIEPDFYAEGGVVAALEKQFITVTGKQAAIYMPSGTMANQLAIAVLSGDNTKVFVQETSHVYRDEADAAQSVHNKRLIPVAPNEAAFTLEMLQAAIKYHDEGEVFKSGIGVVSIENPVRRGDGACFPIEEIHKISAYCREKGYKLHLDGARLHLAAAFTGISVAEYAKHFDTVYISLYKYLGALGGAMLCGDKVVIDKMRHLIKVHGGAVYQNWINGAMALHHLNGIDERLKTMAKKSADLFALLNQLPGCSITPIKNGSNIFYLQTAKDIDANRLRDILAKKHDIYLLRRQGSDPVKLFVNETLLARDNGSIVAAFKDALALAKV